MLNWIDVCAAKDLRPGSWRIIEIEDQEIAVFNIENKYYAITDICTHDGGVLTGGPVEGDEIICPRHGARFCIKTGKVLCAPAYEDLETFPTRISDDGIVQIQYDDA